MDGHGEALVDNPSKVLSKQHERCADQSTAQGNSDDGNREVDDPERQHQQQIGERRPRPGIREHAADACPETCACAGMDRPAWHTLSRYGLEKPTFSQGKYTGNADEYQEE